MPNQFNAKAWLWLVVVIGLGAVCTWFSLADVPGATRNVDGTCCTTQFQHGWWTFAATLLVVPIYLAARSSRWVAVVAVVISSAYVLFIAATVVSRYQSAGWGDGLENFAYVEALIQIGLFVAAWAVGQAADRRRRGRILEPEPPYPPVWTEHR